MEEGEINTEKMASPKANVIRLEETSQAEKGADDEKVSESVKEDGELEDEDGAEKDCEVLAENEDDEVAKEQELPKEGDGGIKEEPIQDDATGEVKEGHDMETEKHKPVKEEFGEMQHEDGEVKDEPKEVVGDVDRAEDEEGEIGETKTEQFQVNDGELRDEPPKEEGEIKDGGDGDGEIKDEPQKQEDGEIKDEEGREIEGKPEKVEDEDGEIKDNLEEGNQVIPILHEAAKLHPADNDVDMSPDTSDCKQEAFGKGEISSEAGGNVPRSQGEPGQMLETHSGAPDTTETEEGELDDSDEKENEKFDAENSSKTAAEKDEMGDIKNNIPRMEFGMDETRPEDEQLDYDEDELEDKMKSGPEPAPTVEQSADVKSDGEVDSASEGEIKSDDGEEIDFEEGETRDHPMDLPPEQKKVCKFFEMGNCTWGDRCRYLHPGVNDKGNYNMFSDPEKARRGPPPPPFHRGPPHGHPPEPFWHEPPPFMPPPAPVAETAWEKGLRHAKELKKRALQRKVQEPDFLQKREVLSLNLALNEDHDMEFVNHEPLGPNNKGFNPFEEDSGEYATPTPEEVRRTLMRDRRRPPPPHRHPQDKDRRLPPPEHMMPHDMRRDRRPPSPRHQGPDRFPMDMRRMSPRREGDRDRRPNLPPDGPGLIRRDIDRRERRDYPDRPDSRGHFSHDPGRRDFPLDRIRDEKLADGGKGDKRLQNGAPIGQSQQWSDPWARGRPQTKGRNVKNASSSSSGSSSGSSSRSSSHSSGSSHSSHSGSSRSSSRSSGSSRSSSFSSDRDSSRSPSPSKGPKPKKKVMISSKQRNAATARKKPPAATVVPTKPPATKPSQPIKAEPAPGLVSKGLPVVNKKAPEKKLPTAAPSANIAKPPVTAKKPTKPKKPESSSSSEFSHSSDSSPSPSRAKAKSGSNSDSGSSSGSSSASSSSGSSSSDSDEGDKPAKRRTGKGTTKTPLGTKGQIPPSATLKPPPLQQHNKGKVTVPSKPGRKDVKMTIIDKPGAPKKRTATEMAGQQKKPSSRRTELLEQLRAVEDAIARKRAKLT